MSKQRVKDVRLEIKARNNLIMRRMEERGILSVAELCRRMKPRGNQGEVGRIINMKMSPLLKGSDVTVPKWRLTVERMAIALKCSPEDLFSKEQLESVLENNRRTLEISIHDLHELRGADLERSLVVHIDEVLERKELARILLEQIGTLTKREQRVLELRYGLGEYDEHTLEEVGEIFSTTRNRIMQIEAKALRRMRHPSRTAQLREAGVFELL